MHVTYVTVYGLPCMRATGGLLADLGVWLPECTAPRRWFWLPGWGLRAKIKIAKAFPEKNKGFSRKPFFCARKPFTSSRKPIDQGYPPICPHRFLSLCTGYHEITGIMHRLPT